MYGICITNHESFCGKMIFSHLKFFLVYFNMSASLPSTILKLFSTHIFFLLYRCADSKFSPSASLFYFRKNLFVFLQNDV